MLDIYFSNFACMFFRVLLLCTRYVNLIDTVFKVPSLFRGLKTGTGSPILFKNCSIVFPLILPRHLRVSLQTRIF